MKFADNNHYAYQFLFSIIYTIVGALCEYVETPASEVIRQSCDSYNNYINSLELTCMNGTSGKLVWTPDEDTPDIVYYQVIKRTSSKLLMLNLK
jgi:hypothetical protein